MYQVKNTYKYFLLYRKGWDIGHRESTKKMGWWKK